MSNTVIKIQNLSKQYRLGLEGSATNRKDLKRWWHKTRGFPEPTLKIGGENKFDLVGSDRIWEFKDINLLVKQREVKI